MNTLSPLEVRLLLVLHAWPDPFGELGDEHAGSPAVRAALERFERRGWLCHSVTWDLLARLHRLGGRPSDTLFLSGVGTALVRRICSVSLENLYPVSTNS